MSGCRKQYETSFKLEVARMVVDQGLTIAQVIHATGVSTSAIRRWVKQYQSELNGQPGQDKPLTAEQQRSRQLQTENRRLRADNELLKKASAFFAQACRVLEISRSGYYAAKASSQKDGGLRANIQEAFIHSGKTYGSRRIVKVLNNKRIKIGRCQVCRLMRQMNLSAVWKRKFKRTTDSTHSLPVTANILIRQFTPAKPNQAWVTDITYIWTQSGWLYLAVILDLFSRKVVGWSMSVTMTADLVCRALVMAIGVRQPLIGLIIHTDRGSQYASHDYQRLLKRYGLIGSVSRKGNCWDNAVAERFFLI